MIYLAKAIRNLRPGAVWAIHDGVLEWRDEVQPVPTDDEINAEVARLQAEDQAKEYQRKRAEAYPSIQEQLDMQYWDAVNGTNNWQEAINAIKVRHPKP